MTRQTTFGGGELAVILPGTWAAIPLGDPEAAKKRISALVKNQVGRSDRLARVRRDVRTQLESLAADASAGQAFSLALSMEILPGVPFPSSMIMSREAWPEGASAAPAAEADDAAQEADDAAEETDGDRGDSDAEHAPLASRIARAYPDARILAFSFGEVARTHAVSTVRYDQESAPQLIADYRFAAPEGDAVIRVHVNAPMAELAELYLELFDAIVDSITFREPLATVP